jgi:hypothetical protein
VSAAAEQAAAARLGKAPVSASVLNYVALGSFSWEQDSDKVKVCDFDVTAFFLFFIEFL